MKKSLYEIKKYSACIESYTPYDKTFVHKVKGLGGRWNSEDKCWRFASWKLDDLVDIIKSVYGVTPEIIEMEDAEAEAKTEEVERVQAVEVSDTDTKSMSKIELIEERQRLINRILEIDVMLLSM